jgi:hypothetical protein
MKDDGMGMTYSTHIIDLGEIFLESLVVKLEGNGRFGYPSVMGG